MLRPVPLLVALALVSCAPAQPPPTREVVHLHGNPYERGLEHGTKLRSKIRSFYTTMLTNSLLPYLSREQPDIASLLTEYQGDRYQNGHFAYELLLDSAKSVERTLPHSVRDELHGVADGSGLTYEQVLVLNTFVDSTLAVRGVALAIRQARAPVMERFEVLGANADGVDNDGDGQVDENDEGVFDPFAPTVGALLTELPPDAKFRFVLKDDDGIEPSTVRVQLGETTYTQDAEELVLEPLDAQRLQVTFTPPTPLPLASTQSLVIGAGDTKLIDLPPPAHRSFMRDEELLFTVKGAGLPAWEVRRPPLTDGRTRPPSFAFGLKGAATEDGNTLLAQHFALLDANTAHKHTIVFVHHPDNGPPFAVVGWAGVVYGFSGLSDTGLGYACNPSDTLDNSVVGSVFENIFDLSKAKLLATGTPMGFLGRKMLETATDVASAKAVLQNAQHVYGWTCVLADDQGGLEAVELDSDIFKDGQDGTYPYTPQDLSPNLSRYASTSDDDLTAVSAFARNVNDIATLNIAGQRIVPQRIWSSFFYRSRRAMDATQRRIQAGFGHLDVQAAEEMLSDPELVDQSDSMNAVVLDLKKRTVWSAMGTVPATAAPFEPTSLTEDAAP